jgi:hypothetical protein
MLQASHYVQTIQDRQDRMVGSPHVAALEQGWLFCNDIRQQLDEFAGHYSEKVLRQMTVNLQ